MPLDIEDVVKEVRWTKVEIGPHSFNVAYRLVSSSIQQESEWRNLTLQMRAEGEETTVDIAQMTAEIVCANVADWDLTRKGVKIPLEVDAVKQIPRELLDAIFPAIRADREISAAEKKALPATSAAISQPGDKSAISQNGTSPSVPQSTWA